MIKFSAYFDFIKLQQSRDMSSARIWRKVFDTQNILPKLERIFLDCYGDRCGHFLFKSSLNPVVYALNQFKLP